MVQWLRLNGDGKNGTMVVVNGFLKTIVKHTYYAMELFYVEE